MNISKLIGVRSVNLLRAVKASSKELKKKTNPLAIPWRCVNFNKTKVITVIDIASTVRNPVLIPNIKKIKEANSWELVEARLDRSIFSGDAKRGTLSTAFIKNKMNREKDTVFAWFWSLGNLTSIALPNTIPWNNPIAKALVTKMIENIGSWKTLTRNGMSANPMNWKNKWEYYLLANAAYKGRVNL